MARWRGGGAGRRLQDRTWRLICLMVGLRWVYRDDVGVAYEPAGETADGLSKAKQYECNIR